MMTPKHGTGEGFRAGCRSRGGCEFDRHSDFLSCAEAEAARSRDITLRRLPDAQLIPRASHLQSRLIESYTHSGETHGTVWGYRRGCTRKDECPHQQIGRQTCADAKAQYYREYARSRLGGTGTPVVHGTRNGYDLGCRSSTNCPGEQTGVTCSQARSQERLTKVRNEGVQPRAVDGSQASDRVQELRALGYSLRGIAALAGIGRATVSSIARARAMSEKSNPVSPVTHAALLAVAVPGGQASVTLRIRDPRTTPTEETS